MKKSYIYILIFIFGLFSFSSDVWAETKRGSITYDEVTKLADQGCDAVGEGKWMKNLTSDKYTGSCMYKASVDKIDGTGKACHLIEIDFGKTDVLITEYDPIKGVKYSNIEKIGEGIFGIQGVDIGYTKSLKGSFTPDSSFSGENILRLTNNVGSCLSFIRVDRNFADGAAYFINTTVYPEGAKGENYTIAYVRGYSSGTGEKLSLDTTLNIEFIKNENITNCEQLFGKKLVKMFKSCWNVLKIAVPVILLGLGTLDFAKAVFSSEDNMKKAQSKFIKRVIIAVCIFVIPSVLVLLLNISNEIFGIFGKNGTDICGLFG